VILAIFAPQALATAAFALGAMLSMCGILILIDRKPVSQGELPLLHLESPFSLRSALKYGCIFLILQVITVVAQQWLGQVGVYVASLLGGLVSSASAVASAASLASQGAISSASAGGSAVIASLTSALMNLPLIIRARQRQLTWRFVWATGAVMGLGIIGMIVQYYVVPQVFATR